MKFDLGAELKFACALFEKARDGFEDVPNPIDFLENGEYHCSTWKEQKQMLLEEEENANEARAFLSCATAKYLDFMVALYENANEAVSHSTEC